MRFTGGADAKKQAQQATEGFTQAANSFKSLLEGLTSQLSPQEKADYANYKNTPEGRKQSAIFDKIREGVGEVMDNIPKQ